MEAPALPPTESAAESRFASSVICSSCHSNSPRATAMRDASGEPIGAFDLWRGSMMAASGRDPLWRAVVSVEAAANPEHAGEIVATCLRYHAPMAARQPAVREGKGPTMGLVSGAGGARARPALDGVSCATCHQISARDLGEESTFSGRFHLGPEGRIFGPHADPFFMPMLRHTGYRPTEASHVRESRLCAPCHTLATDTLAADGRVVGHGFLEQAPYLEWRNSL